ncbi:Polygalacturonase [Reichenbachiella faecimaris]|uniref:Polygalacturonase n=2 Tax=Reichenbachiella faecimaris TaxID=692418 RepID=A0A1W2G6Z2_REIFA|nr:Polygalacturonase [Reichenbachiella faecimaris]
MSFGKLVLVGVLTILGAGGLNYSTPAIEEQQGIYEGVEFDMPRVLEPNIPDYTVSIASFGAVADGMTDNTDAFAGAIAQATQKGGGKVVVPRGIWLTGPITLKSNINLHVEAGALVVFDDDFDKYPLVATSFEGLETYRCVSPINGKNLSNVAITGEGTFDGSGDSWRAIKKEKLTEGQWKRKIKSGGILSDDKQTWYPSEKSKKGDTAGNFNVPDLDTIEEFEAVKDFLRPVMVSLISCNKVLLDGPTFQNSPAWNLHPLMCENVILRNLKIRNPWYSQNGDGLDLESCKNVLIYNNTFDVGDDAICIKSGKNEDGLKRAIPTENVVIKKNTVFHGHGGFVVGSEMSGGVKNMHVSNCTFIGTDCGLRFKSTRGRGGVVENIFISNIDMINIEAEAIRFNLFYGGESPVGSDGEVGKTRQKTDPVPVTRTTPSFKNISMKNITSTGAGIAGFFQGLPEMKLQNITLENVVLEANRGITIIDAEAFDWSGVTIKVAKGKPVTLFNTSQMNFTNLTLSGKNDNALINVYGDSQVDFSNSTIKKGQIFISKEVGMKNVKFD